MVLNVETGWPTFSRQRETRGVHTYSFTFDLRFWKQEMIFLSGLRQVTWKEQLINWNKENGGMRVPIIEKPRRQAMSTLIYALQV